MALLNPNKDLEQLKYAAATARRPFEKDWWLNIAFFLGEQYVEWSAQDLNIRRIRPHTDPARRLPRPVINKINHFVLQQHATSMGDRAVLDCLPAGTDPLQLSDGAVGKAYLDWFSDPGVGNVTRAISQAKLWALVCGPSFLQWVWNPRLKRPEVLPLSPFDLYPDPYATDFKRARYVIHARFMDPEQVFDAYGVEVKSNEVDKADDLKIQLLREMGSAPVLRGVTVNELWHRPTRRYPNGRYIVWTGKDRLIDQEQFPYTHKHLPFTMLGVVPRPGTIWYDSNVKYLRPGQMELNQYHAQRIQIRKNFAAPKWGIDEQLEMKEMPDDSPNQILRYNSQGGQFKPELFQPAAMADNNEGQWIGEEMMNIVGLHEVSQGQVPGRVEAAKAIAELKDSDTSRLAELTDMETDALTEGGWQVLQLAQQFQDEDTLLTCYSAEGVPEVRRFKKDAIHEGMRVKVLRGTGLGRTRVEREDKIFRLIEAGVLVDPQAIAEMLDVPMTQFISQVADDVRLARNENFDMADGVAIMPNSWDNHAIHIREHNRYRKSHEFLLLSNQTKSKFEFHVKNHETLQKTELVKQIQLAQLAAQAAGQAPAPGPTPSGGGSQLPGNQPIGAFTGPGAMAQQDNGG